ncbi:hypothetical protein MPH_09731 [Macrophomina phaseolina MS6]|uniref:3-hydroxyacyl-CoA dehydrogenase n=1 Tax=Macrophomina phaseolina (strain MS6) TaxID=1126212 RepID=K2QTT0_MACPH|nr:hypothetical protein MPH_09731 [Macrophomina phaseolina MS6]
MGSIAQNWKPPQGYESRPVAVLGAGVLGRRIASCWAAAGYEVHVRDPDSKQREDCIQYVNENLQAFQHLARNVPSGSTATFKDVESAVQDAWLVFECVPEKLQLKIDTFAELEKLAPNDCILATNSSSYKSSEMLEKVSEATKQRILNTHYFMPPKIMAAELMTDGHTSPEIFPFLVERFREAGLKPYVARRESTGFIFNRLWAAVKRELLTILAEDVADVPTLDAIYSDVILGGSYPPFKLMDLTGLDTVAFIEEHYIKERGLPSTNLDYLRQNYIDKGKLGNKSARGGFYPPTTSTTSDFSSSSSAQLTPPRRLLALDLGLSSPTHFRNAGSLLELTLPSPLASTATLRTLLSNLPSPDGLAICPRTRRIFWTTMGSIGQPDGALHTATLPSLSDARALVPARDERVHTPKQVAVDSEARKVYFCDREGMRVLRCGYDDGGEVEVLVANGDWRVDAERADTAERWCVGVAVGKGVGKVFWSQKGPSKGGKGRILCKSLDGPGEEAAVVVEGLPEPIDLEWVEKEGEEGGWLYWSDRGELPFGNSLNVVRLDGRGRVVEDEKVEGPRKHRILATKFNEAIGLKVDADGGRIYVADLGGAIWCCDLEGRGKKKVYEDENRAFPGLAML